MSNPGVSASTSPTMPSASRVSDSVNRPSRDRGLAGRAGGGGGGAVTRPGYGNGLLSYGPCGANGGRYPVGSSTAGSTGGSAVVVGCAVVIGSAIIVGGGPVGGGAAGGGAAGNGAPRVRRLLISTTAAAITVPTTRTPRSCPKTKEVAAMVASAAATTTSTGEVRDRPWPNNASSGEPVSPSAGMSSQPTTYTKMLRPPASVRTANSTRHSTG